MRTTQKIVQNTGQRKTTSSSVLSKPGNTYAHAPEVSISPVFQMNSPFTSVSPLFGTAQAILLRLAQLEAQLTLNLISNFTAGNHSGYGDPFVLLCHLQAAATQRTPLLYQPPSVVALSHLLHRRNITSVTHMVNPPSSPSTMMSSITKISSGVANKESWTAQGNQQVKKVIQRRSIGLSSNTTVLQPASKEPLYGSNTKHLGQNFSFKPSVDCSQCKTMTAVKASANGMMFPDREASKTSDSTALGGEEPKQQMQHLPSEHLMKTLASLGLSLEDLDLLSHCPDDHLTTEMFPLIIQDMQQRKGTKTIINSSHESNMSGRVIDYGHASRTSSNQMETSRKPPYTYRKHHAQGCHRHSKLQEDHLSQSVSPSSSSFTSPALHSTYGHSCNVHTHNSLRSKRFSPSDLIYKNLSTQSRALKRDSSGRISKLFLKGLQHGHAGVTRKRPESVHIPSRSIRHSFVFPERNKTRTYTIQRPSTHSRSATSNAMRKGHEQLLFSSLTSVTTESRNIQTPVNKETEKTSTQTRGVIRVSRIPLDYSESELLRMAAPFGQPVEVLMATEVDMVTRLEWKKALMTLPTELSAQEMVKVYSAIPLHMREQSLELVSQTVDITSPVSVFHALVGPSASNGLLTPADHLLVVCNVPHQPYAAIGVLRLLKPFGKVFQTLVFCGNKVDVDQCPGNNNCIQMVLEMESAAVASSVYEWSQKIPCVYHNHHLSFLKGSNILKNTLEVKST